MTIEEAKDLMHFKYHVLFKSDRLTTHS